jgi:hypothetical protein
VVTLPLSRRRRKLDTVRLALRRGDIAEAAKHAHVFELTPVAVK